MKKYKIAVLDDYQDVALESADWSVLRDRADIAIFQDHLADPDAVIERLLPFDVVCAMRERTPLPRNIIERLPNLKLIASTGSVNSSIDVAAAGDHGIAVVHTGYRSDPTIEFTWALILASARHIVTESNSVLVCSTTEDTFQAFCANNGRSPVRHDLESTLGTNRILPGCATLRQAMRQFLKSTWESLDREAWQRFFMAVAGGQASLIKQL